MLCVVEPPPFPEHSHPANRTPCPRSQPHPQWLSICSSQPVCGFASWRRFVESGSPAMWPHGSAGPGASCPQGPSRGSGPRGSVPVHGQSTLCRHPLVHVPADGLPPASHAPHACRHVLQGRKRGHRVEATQASLGASVSPAVRGAMESLKPKPNVSDPHSENCSEYLCLGPEAPAGLDGHVHARHAGFR